MRYGIVRDDETRMNKLLMTAATDCDIILTSGAHRQGLAM